MNEKEKQLYETLKMARNYFLKRVDILQKKINKEGLYIDIEDDLTNFSIIEINNLQARIINLQQQGEDPQLLQILVEDLEMLYVDLNISESSKKYSYYHIEQAKDKIKLYISKINYIDHKIETLCSK